MGGQDHPRALLVLMGTLMWMSEIPARLRKGDVPFPSQVSLLSNLEWFYSSTPLPLRLVLAKRRSGHQWVMVSGLTALHMLGGKAESLSGPLLP